MTRKPIPSKSAKGLGRGLSSLMADIDAAPVKTDVSAGADRGPRLVPIEKIRPNRDQPRKTFGEKELNELASSIKLRGVIQPLIVRLDPAHSGEFQIIAGERRWRAAQIAGLHDLPVIEREMDDIEVMEVAIIENIQREDLNPIDEAQSYRQLMDKYGHTQERLSEALGKSRSHIANLLRLLRLPNDVLDLVRQGELSMGHARALVNSENAVALAQMVIARNLSVREVEELMQRPEHSASKPRPVKQAKDQDTIELEKNLAAELGLKARIDHKGGKGVLKLHYRDLEQLDAIVRRLVGDDIS